MVERRLQERDRMRRILFHIVVLMIGLSVYAASPFVAAWRMREAVKAGDANYIESRVDWDRVRGTLKESLARHAQLGPMATAAGGEVRPSIWQRIKGAFGQSMLDRFVENYVTPEGLPQLFSYRKTWRETIKGEPDERLTLAWHERFRKFYDRVKRAEFLSLTQVEVEMADRDTPDRRYVSVFELREFTWTLVGLRVKALDAATRLAEIERSPS
jgi:hypothetical protein